MEKGKVEGESQMLALWEKDIVGLTKIIVILGPERIFS